MASKFSITNSVLNTESLKQAVNDYKITYLSPDEIKANQFNFYNVEDVETLKESISQQGLQQPLLVTPDQNGEYTIISGHRRYAAISALRSEGSKKFDTLPCRVITGSADELQLALINANATARELTDYERMEQVRLTREILKRLRKNGYALSGRQRDLIAEKTGMSATQVQRFDFISKNLIPELKKGFEEQRIPLTVAESLAKLPEDVQKKAGTQLIKKGSISQADVDRLCAAAEMQESKEPQKIGYSDFDYLSHFIKKLKNADFSQCNDSEPLEKINRLNQNLKKEIARLEKLIKL